MKYIHSELHRLHVSPSQLFPLLYTGKGGDNAWTMMVQEPSELKSFLVNAAIKREQIINQGYFFTSIKHNLIGK